MMLLIRLIPETSGMLKANIFQCLISTEFLDSMIDCIHWHFAPP